MKMQDNNLEKIEESIISLLNEANTKLTKDEFDELSQSIISYIDDLWQEKK